MAVQRVNLRVRFADNEDAFSDDEEDRDLFIALSQFLWNYGHAHGYY